MRLRVLPQRGSWLTPGVEIELGTLKPKRFIPLVLAHELGHIKEGATIGDSQECLLLRELRAWAYAFQKAPSPPTRMVRREVARCLKTYIPHCRHSETRRKTKDLCVKLQK